MPAQDRVDERTRVRLEAERDLDSTWSVQAETTYIDNQSSDSASRYHKYEVMFSLNAVF